MIKQNLKWGKDNKRIENIIAEFKNSNPIVCNECCNISICFCNTDIIKHHIKCQYMNIKDYSKDDDMEYIHNILCPIHATYLTKYPSEREYFEKNNTDKWVQCFSKLKNFFREIMNTSPERIGLMNYVYINNYY